MTFGLDLDNEYNKVYRVFIFDLMNIPSSIYKQGLRAPRRKEAVRPFAAITLSTICNFVFISLRAMNRSLIFACVNKQRQLPALVRLGTSLHAALGTQIWALWALTLAANSQIAARGVQ